MPATMRSGAATKLKMVGGKYLSKSARSKTGNTECSKAMSDWKSGRASAASVGPILGKCRAQSHALKKGVMYREAGQELKAQVHEHRATTGTVGVKARASRAREMIEARRKGQAARAASHGPAGPSIKEQVKGATELNRPVEKASPTTHKKGGALADRIRARAEADLATARKGIADDKAKAENKPVRKGPMSFFSHGGKGESVATKARPKADAHKQIFDLREQAAMHRATKGSPETRAAQMAERAKVKAGVYKEKAEATEKSVEHARRVLDGPATPTASLHEAMHKTIKMGTKAAVRARAHQTVLSIRARALKDRSENVQGPAHTTAGGKKPSHLVPGHEARVAAHASRIAEGLKAREGKKAVGKKATLEATIKAAPASSKAAEAIASATSAKAPKSKLEKSVEKIAGRVEKHTKNVDSIMSKAEKLQEMRAKREHMEKTSIKAQKEAHAAKGKAAKVTETVASAAPSIKETAAGNRSMKGLPQERKINIAARLREKAKKLRTGDEGHRERAGKYERAAASLRGEPSLKQQAESYRRQEGSLDPETRKITAQNIRAQGATRRHFEKQEAASRKEPSLKQQVQGHREHLGKADPDFRRIAAFDIKTQRKTKGEFKRQMAEEDAAKAAPAVAKVAEAKAHPGHPPVERATGIGTHNPQAGPHTEVARSKTKATHAERLARIDKRAKEIQKGLSGRLEAIPETQHTYAGKLSPKVAHIVKRMNKTMKHTAAYRKSVAEEAIARAKHARA